MTDELVISRPVILAIGLVVLIIIGTALFTFSPDARDMILQLLGGWRFWGSDCYGDITQPLDLGRLDMDEEGYIENETCFFKPQKGDYQEYFNFTVAKDGTVILDMVVSEKGTPPDPPILGPKIKTDIFQVYLKDEDGEIIKDCDCFIIKDDGTTWYRLGENCELSGSWALEGGDAVSCSFYAEKRDTIDIDVLDLCITASSSKPTCRRPQDYDDIPMQIIFDLTLIEEENNCQTCLRVGGEYCDGTLSDSCKIARKCANAVGNCLLGECITEIEDCEGLSSKSESSSSQESPSGEFKWEVPDE